MDPTRASLRAVVGNLGITAIAVATGGLPFRFQDRISNSAALAGSFGSTAGLISLMRAYAGPFLLVAGSSLLVWDLARVRALRRWLASALRCFAATRSSDQPRSRKEIEKRLNKQRALAFHLMVV